MPAVHIDLADLHMHSHYSDGFSSPAELVEAALEAGLKAISLTDHDCIDGIEELGSAAGSRILTIPGVELSCIVEEREVHVLGYAFDPSDSTLNAQLRMISARRTQRADRIVAKLKAMGMPISLDDVLARATNGNVGRPHIAEEVVSKGYAADIFEVFNKYLGYGCKAYEPKFELSPRLGIEMIRRAGGKAVLAHPGIRFKEKVLLEMIRTGLDGIECIHPKHKDAARSYFRKLCEQYTLLETGGSDYHGRPTDAPIGSHPIEYEKIKVLVPSSIHEVTPD